MSFRNTFITSFIYQASEETREANLEVEKVFAKYANFLANKVDERGYGFYAGVIKTLDGSIHGVDIDLPLLAKELEKATKVPFTLTVLFESGPTITYEIRPFNE